MKIGDKVKWTHSGTKRTMRGTISGITGNSATITTDEGTIVTVPLGDLELDV